MGAMHIGVARFDRVGRLVTHGHVDRHSRPDAVQFTGRSGERLVDCAGEITVTIDRWGTRTGIAALFEADEDGIWQLVATSMPFDGIYVLKEQTARLVFSVWAPIRAGRIYRLHLPGAVVTQPTIHIAAVLHDPAQLDEDKPKRPRRIQPPPSATKADLKVGQQQGALAW